MSEARQEDMATIDAMLDTPPADTSDTPDTEGDKVTPHAAPDVPGNEDEDEEKDEEAKSETPLTPGNEAGYVAQQFADKVKQVVGGVAGDVRNWLEGASIPGGLFLPISLLILFFFVLIPFNGYSRLAWLWLTVTGNAELQGEAAAKMARQQEMITTETTLLQALSGTSLSSGNWPTTTTTQALTTESSVPGLSKNALPGGPNVKPLFTGVEEVQ